MDRGRLKTWRVANGFWGIRNAGHLCQMPSNSQDEGIVAGHLVDGTEETIQGNDSIRFNEFCIEILEYSWCALLAG